MSNALVKGFNTVTIYNSVTSIPSGGSPGEPARTYYQPVTSCGYRIVGVKYVWVQPAPGSGPYAQPEYVPVLPPGGIGGSYQYEYSCVTTQVLVTVAAIPPTPPGPVTVTIVSRTESLPDLSWSGGGDSIVRLIGSVVAQFSVTSAVGVVAGLSQTVSQGNYSAIPHGLMFVNGVMYVVESGVQVYSGGSYSSTDVWKIQRATGVVTYKKNGTTIYTSLVPSLGAVALDTSMFATGDTIDLPSLVPFTSSFGGGATRLPRLRSFGGLATYNMARVSLPHLTSSGADGSLGGTLSGTHLQLPRLRSIGANFAYGELLMALPMPRFVVYGGLTLPRYGLGSTIMPVLQVYGTSLTGGLGQAVATLPKLTSIGGKGTGKGQAHLRLPHLLVHTYTFDGSNSGFIGSVLTSHTTLSTNNFIAVSMTSNGTIHFVSSMTFQALLSMNSRLTISDSQLLSLIRTATMRSSLTAAFGVPGVAEGSQVWVINCDTLASSRYEQFNFNSFARQGDRYFGARGDGVYVLGGDKDGTEPVVASANFGRLDFGMTEKKAVPAIYLGVSSTGVMLVRVTNEQGTFTYAARTSSASMTEQRVDLGKGLRANYYTFELLNQAGCDFQLDDVEFRIVPTTRRIQ